MKEKYEIWFGKFDNSGNGDYDIDSYETYEDALKAFEERVQFERETIKAWSLRFNEHLEIALFKVCDGNEECLKEVIIRRNGSMEKFN